MFGWLRDRLAGWLAHATPSNTKAATGQTLTSFLGPGGSSPGGWSDAAARQFNTNWVFACVRVIASRIAGRAVRVGRVSATSGPRTGKAKASAPPWCRPGSVTELDTHPLLVALHDANPLCTPWALIYSLVASLELSGLGYLWADAETDGTLRLWHLPTSWIRDDPDSPTPLTSFLVTPTRGGEQFTLSNEELLRIALPNPADPLDSLSPLRAGVTAVRTDAEIQTAQHRAFTNGATPGLLVTVGRSSENSPIGEKDDRPILTRQQRKALTALIKEAHQGSINYAEPLILDGHIQKVEKLSNVAAEVDFLNSAGLTKERITQLFGVNPIVLGQVEGANRASATVADEHLCFSTLAPLCVLVGQALTRFFRVHYEDDTLVVWLDPPEPRDPDGRRADMEQAARYGAVTVNEMRAEIGLAPIAGGDVPVKASQQQQQAAPTQGA